MNFCLFDKAGASLQITTDIASHSFEAITCSPHADGFTVLNALGIKSMSKAELEAACAETTLRDEVCVLPARVSSRWRVLLTPTLRTMDPGSRVAATRLMKDLLRAAQAPEVEARTLLITHFAHISAYPQQHVLGILDALKSAAGESHGCLTLVGIEFRSEHVHLFEADALESLAS